MEPHKKSKGKYTQMSALSNVIKNGNNLYCGTRHIDLKNPKKAKIACIKETRSWDRSLPQKHKFYNWSSLTESNLHKLYKQQIQRWIWR